VGVIVEATRLQVGDKVWFRHIPYNQSNEDTYYQQTRPSIRLQGDNRFLQDLPWFTGLACVVDRLWENGRKHNDRHYWYGVALDPELTATNEHFVQDSLIDPECNMSKVTLIPGNCFPDFMLTLR